MARARLAQVIGARGNGADVQLRLAMRTWYERESVRKSWRPRYSAKVDAIIATYFEGIDNPRVKRRLLLGSAPPLQRVAEGGEYKYGSLTENKATLLLEKFGRLISLTWETLINDDLSAFVNVPNAMGAAARRAEADEVYALFTANSGAGMQMQDGVNLFDAAHANISATSGAVSIVTLGAARALLRKQQALGNGGYLNLAHVISLCRRNRRLRPSKFSRKRLVTSIERPARPPSAPPLRRLSMAQSL